LDPIATSFIELDPGEAILSTWKGAEDGDGYILRLYNTKDQPLVAKLGFPHFHFDRVYRCNLVEVNQEALDPQQGRVVLPLGPHEIGTVRVTGFRLR
jgi:alpha-mannosidase